MMRNRLYVSLALVLGFATTGCFFRSKTRSSTAQPAKTEPQYKNKGQERAAEVHERNAERKEAKEADKAAKK